MNQHLSTTTTPLTNSSAEKYDELILPPEGHCFHCGDLVPTPPFTTVILGECREMCCLGCQLAAQSIVEAGLESYYLDRSEISRTASMPTELDRLQAYDHAEIQAQFVYVENSGSKTQSVAELSVTGLKCAACTWLIETRLMTVEGVKLCQVNLTNQRMRIAWDEQTLPVSQILATINAIGYEAKPYRQDTHEAMLAKQHKTMLIRLGISALAAMQAMMFAVGLYFGEYSGMLTVQRDFLRWVSLFVSIPVVFYAAVPFFRSALSAMRLRQVNMDVPVSIAIIVTFLASLYATITGQGETYFDSVGMFVFFLLAGRYIEHHARLKATNMANDLVVVEPVLLKKIAQLNDTDLIFKNSLSEKILIELAGLSVNVNLSTNQVDDQPKWSESDATLIKQHNDFQKSDANKAYQIISETLTSQGVKAGDVVYVEAGMQIVADGILCSERATVSQSLLTGESDLLVKHRGEQIIGGSQNDSQPFVMVVSATANDSQMALIDRLMNRAMSEKPKIAEQADRWARWFVARILVLSVGVFFCWYIVDADQALWATVAVLVATCPCALSLATPIALTVATNRLASYGFLITRGHTLETLAQVSQIAFDKTGTLTQGKPTLLSIQPVSLILDQAHNTLEASQISANWREAGLLQDMLAVAASLEVGSRHPIAHALLEAAHRCHLPKASRVTHYSAGGIEATVQLPKQLDKVVQAYLNSALIEKTIDNRHKAEKSNFFGPEDGGFSCRIGHIDFALNSNGDSHLTTESKNGLVCGDIDSDVLGNQPQASSKIFLSIYVSGKWQLLAIFYLRDQIRDGMAALIKQLKRQNITPLILTGDPSVHGIDVATTLDIQNVHKGLSPEQKLEHIRKLQDAGEVVMMVGDGINDAPVLAGANVSAAVAGVADLAQVSSDAIILNGAVQAVIDAKRIANLTHRIIKQNITWALVYNVVVLIPAALGYVPPWLAAIGMSLSSFVVVMNALRLKRA